ncbi:hypothetical protein NDN08_002105 [Rhodosorus marinus]|uniref:FAD-binding FR-type domain-containing protein n=1 Tax=Rhodosorus marinus TaxID=101924 RepID=A0AAV8UST1_9RHOD|nr:hypothetical protein NDN08_002105 [Rhodosorus marinus]
MYPLIAQDMHLSFDTIVTSVDRSGDNLTLEALDENLKDTNKSERILRDLQARIWKQRFVVGKSWYRTTWSWGDLIATFILVTANLIWGLFGYLKAVNEHRHHLEMITGRKEYMLTLTYYWAYLAAYAGMFDAGAAILFTLRENHLIRTTMGPEGGQYFHGIKYHIGLGYLTFAILTVHSFVILGLEMYYSDYDTYHVLNPTAGWLGHTDFWGLLAWIALALMVVGSLWAVRRWNYRVFYWSHQLYIVFFFAAAVHFPTAIYPIVGALLYFSLDRLAPYLNFARGVTGKATRVAEEIIRVDVPLVRLVNQEYAPGDWYNLRIPSVNLINWHPFSIGSFYRNTPSHATVFVKARGSWTDKLLVKVPEVG